MQLEHSESQQKAADDSAIVRLCREAFPGIENKNHSYTLEQVRYSAWSNPREEAQRPLALRYLAKELKVTGDLSLVNNAFMAGKCGEKLTTDDMIKAAETKLADGLVARKSEIQILSIIDGPSSRPNPVPGPNFTESETAVFKAMQRESPEGYSARVHRDPPHPLPPGFHPGQEATRTTYSIYVERK